MWVRVLPAERYEGSRGSLIVVVATPEADCAATRALYAEGVPYSAHLTLGEWDYGSLWWSLWNEGRPFIVVEWDIAPWPGAIRTLDQCTSAWCTHRYPLHRTSDGAQITTSFGINKIRPIGPAPNAWLSTEWRLLDGLVVPVVRDRLGDSHIHEPPVAHVKAR